jgi:hypothetical protein
VTVLKLTSSGKAIQVVDDFGNVYQTSVNSIHFLLSGKAKGGFITTNRMPYKVAADRFKPSEVWVPDGVDPRTLEGPAGSELTASGDAYSKKDREQKKEVKQFEDKKVEW